MRLSTPRAALAAALLGLPLAASAQPNPPPTGNPVGTVTVDGTLTDSPYTLLGTNAGGPAPGFSGANQLTALYAHVDNGVLYLGVGGNIDNNNRIVIFVDSRAGGFATGDFGAAGPGGVSNFNAGHQFDAGFTADFAIAIGTDGARSDYYVDVVELGGTRAAGASTSRYLGSANASVVPGSDVAAVVTSDPNNTTSGFELQIPIGATASGTTPIATDRNSMQFFAIVTGDSGFLSNSFLSPAGPNDGNYGNGVVNFELAAPDPLSYVWQPIAGRKGWRHLAWPVAGGIVGSYAAQNFVQGPGTAYPTGASNVIVAYSTFGSVYQYATGLSYPLTSGRGQLWYHYDAADFPGGVAPASYRARPYTLRAGGKEPQANVELYFSELDTGFAIGGNPFSLDFDTQGISLANGLFAGPLVYVWDADAGTNGAYVTVDRNAAAVADRTVAPMQGFWFESRRPTPTRPGGEALGGGFFATYAQTARVQGAEPILARTAAQHVLAFQLDRLTPQGPVLEWQAARLAFVDGAGEGSDAFDGGLPPAIDAASDVRMAFVGEDGEMRGQLSRAYDAPASGTAEARLALRVAGRAAGTTYRLSWPTIADLPQGWTATLTDGDTGATVDLRTADHVDVVASESDWTERFTVRVSARSTAGEAGPATVRLGAATPNPVTAEARVALSVDAPQHVRADLFDALGRHVAVVLDADVRAPRDLVVDARTLVPGVYVLRVSGDTFSETRRLTVAR